MFNCWIKASTEKISLKAAPVPILADLIQLLAFSEGSLHPMTSYVLMVPFQHPFGCWRRRYPTGLQKKFILLLFILFSRPNLLQLLSRIPRPSARHEMVSLPLYPLQLSVHTVPHILPIGPNPFFPTPAFRKLKVLQGSWSLSTCVAQTSSESLVKWPCWMTDSPAKTRAAFFPPLKCPVHWSQSLQR